MSGIRQRFPAALTAFGEDVSTLCTSHLAPSTFFTGKPHVVGLGHTFLFRNYRTSLGKWQTADPLGYPDGWNQLAYCGNLVQQCIDVYGGEAAIIGSFYDALKHYAYGNGVPAIIFQSVMLQVLSTVGYVDNVLKGIVSALATVPYDKPSGDFTLSGIILWEQGDVLGRTSTVWDFKAHKNDPWWKTVFDEYLAGSCADLFSYLSTGNRGEVYKLSGLAHVEVARNAYQYRVVE